MGLDVTAYSKIQKVDAVYNEYGEPIDPVTRKEFDDVAILYVNSDFPARAEDIENGVYSYTEGFGFRAGSYGGYNRWREQLAEMAGYPIAQDPDPIGDPRQNHSAGAWQADGGPFWELIWFSDCEGTIGPAVCNKLADDFAKYQDKADMHDDENFKHKYKEWRQAFELAANDGAVHFH